MRLLYNISIHVYKILITAASSLNPKAKLWLDGRKNIFEKLASSISATCSPGSKLAWFHCASLGEFEQGRPLIERYKAQHPDVKILLTFFSPSGYEIRKDYKGADLVCYLPADTPSNAKRFLEIVKPSAVFFVKYEFWFNYLAELKRRDVPTYLISGIFREEQHFFKFYGSWFRKQFSSFTHFFLQDLRSEELLHSIGYKNTTVAGDTRFDRVSEIAKNVRPFPLIEKFKGGHRVLIAGSTWKEDEELIAGSAQENLKLIIAPHEIDEKHIESICALFSKYSVIRYSQATESAVAAAQVLVIDNIGMLSSLYQYGTFAFIGGGFGKGIHNILEAATFGLPVVFGPNYDKFKEAVDLVKTGGAFSVSGKAEFENVRALLSDEQVLKTASHISKYYVESRTGATEKIMNAVKF
ncbi:MAG: 3-deoxy-D-manno-octulosonic acid transferase [Bacteroidetes bacterium]|nr:3-deoxy-D-manno-octulosonic acid transferase [Bacteroidota bacterium]